MGIQLAADDPEVGGRRSTGLEFFSRPPVVRREKVMKYTPPGQPGSLVSVEPRYENFIGGKWLPPAMGKYRVNLSPATAKPICEVAESTPEDVELALDAAHAAKDEWGAKPGAQRAGSARGPVLGTFVSTGLGLCFVDRHQAGWQGVRGGLGTDPQAGPRWRGFQPG